MTRHPPADLPWPAPNPDTAPFWEACRRHELVLQRCDDCGRHRFHPRPRCPWCASAAATWTPVSGRGTIHTFTVCHPPVLPAFAERVPYPAIVVQLAEGPFIVGNLVGAAPDDLRIGREVEVAFVEVDEELTLPQWRPVRPE